MSRNSNATSAVAAGVVFPEGFPQLYPATPFIVKANQVTAIH
jgi:hypothetical protein